jgi:hypothetical protein
VSDQDQPTHTEPAAIAEGRRPEFPADSARAIAEASAAAGFPPPAQHEALLEGGAQSEPATPAEPKE